MLPSRLALLARPKPPTLSTLPRPSIINRRPYTTPTQRPLPPTPPSENIFTLVSSARPAVRYTLYTAFGLLATAECTFWVKVIRHKYFATEGEEEDPYVTAALDKFGKLEKVWLPKYRYWFGTGVWGWE
ncbi:hypothetical protein P154DRAFT_523957 [Amniculicola lignicola CBS 123094]|uniref:Uncharacterized protein n=1 Tax=Amniculicola lignicola CBS 123094 TaxID=1392246 RepID=A0A6A5WB81_9PLEO|nr:hypothetical protein P154DRAFT_523957 [Amniculicola lignicola CBS 123094]